MGCCRGAQKFGSCCSEVELHVEGGAGSTQVFCKAGCPERLKDFSNMHLKNQGDPPCMFLRRA